MKKTVYHTARHSSTNWSILVNARGESGKLNKIGVRNARTIHFLRAFVDGEEITDRIQGSDDNPVSETIPIEMEFENSMKVEHKSAQVDKGATFFVNFSYDVPDQPDSIFERCTNAVEAKTGVNAGLVFTIIGIALTIIFGIIGLII